MEVSSISLVFRDEMQLRTEMRYYYVSISIAKIKKKTHTKFENNKYFKRCGVSGILIQGNIKWDRHLGK